MIVVDSSMERTDVTTITLMHNVASRRQANILRLFNTGGINEALVKLPTRKVDCNFYSAVLHT